MGEIMNKKNKKAQEEMVGFALIIIVVSIILMIFLAFYLNREPKKETVESYEAESFTQAFLQYTTSCTDNFEFLNVQDVIYECDIRNTCANGEDPCEDRKSTRLNSSHMSISYAVFCLKKKK